LQKSSQITLVRHHQVRHDDLLLHAYKCCNRLRANRTKLFCSPVV
jgi:hypothetical protein